MNRKSHCCPALLFVWPLMLWVVAVNAEAPTDAQLWAEAGARIEQHRKRDGEVQVVDGDGRPVAGAPVVIEQQRHAFLFGCNLFNWGTLPSQELQEEYRARFAGLFNFATLPFYWPTYEPQPGRPQHAQREQVARWCSENGLVTKGHPLAWNYDDPKWLPNDTNEVRRLQMARITDCVERFRGQIDCWDVVNEATQFDRQQMREQAPVLTGMWRMTGRLAFTRECFRRARAANPEAVLLINDYRTDRKYEELIEQLSEVSGTPLFDVIGIQSHMHTGLWGNRKIWDVCERFARFEAPLHFTETTILSGEQAWEGPNPWLTTPEGEVHQAREIVRFYTMLFSHPAVEAITWWDFSDHSAWKRAPAGLLRKDMTPKPAYDALVELINHVWRTRMDRTSGVDGTVPFRGFLGSYRVTVSREGKPPMVRTFRLDRESNAPWVVQCP